MVLYCVGFSHEVMQQIRTHRVGCSFDVVSGRYSGQRIIDVANGKRTVDEVYYIRPAGFYTDRQGKKYYWSEDQREEDREFCLVLSRRYAQRYSEGLSEEHCRQINSIYGLRQNWTVSGSARFFMHLFEMRSTLDVQLETQKFVALAYPHALNWMPEVFGHHLATRMYKNKLAP